MSRLIQEFKSLKNDVDRWIWVIEHKDQGILVSLDNDLTMVIDKSIVDLDQAEEDGIDYYANFDDYLGWSGGIGDLLNTIGIEWKCV